MRVSHLQLADFRSYEDLNLELAPGVSAFVGHNGQGKTNLVEALGYVATLGSHRVSTDAPLVRAGAQRAVIRTAIVKGERVATVELEITPGKANRARVNRSPASRARDVLGILRTVLFAPEDLALVKGGPGERRRFLDDLLVARAPRYAGVRADYERVLKQRNALLKSASGPGRRPPADLSTLDVWDEHLANVGAELLAARQALTQELQPLVAKAYADLASARGLPGLVYRPSIPTPDPVTAHGGSPELGSAVQEPESPPAPNGERERLVKLLREAMAQSRQDELRRGVSLVGPHRDDLVLSLGNLPAQGYASQGECWSLALALRLASYELLRFDGDDPVLILDDVFAELDTERRTRLAEHVGGAEQVLVSAAVAEDIPPELSGIRFHVHEGVVQRA